MFNRFVAGIQVSARTEIKTMATTSQAIQPDYAINEALKLLNKDKLLLAVHDSSFPSLFNEDTGRGTPYSHGGVEFTRFVRNLGFNGIQLGPQGQTSHINASPYDGTIFSRNFLSLDLHSLAFDPLCGGWLNEATWQEIVASNPQSGGERTAYTYAFDRYTRAVTEIYQRFTEERSKGDPHALEINKALIAFWQINRWLQDDALYEALCVEHGDKHWQSWHTEGDAAWDKVLCFPLTGTEVACVQRRHNLETHYKPVLERYALIQLILMRQHQSYRQVTESLGIKLFGDVQVGFSPRDTWSRHNLLLHQYFMGAPPSRTNPEGQPWGYAVLDPAQYLTPDGKPGPVSNFVAERLGKMLSEFDGLRLDHPHGLICPWVYRTDDPDPLHAVQNGARLFASPDLQDHPKLNRFAIIRPDQINRGRQRYADDWVRELTTEQEERYASVMDILMKVAQVHDRKKEDILCEVLSTQPYPLERVMQRHELGRFRVTQKANLNEAQDVYRSENALPQDWIMAGNHDTPSIWSLARAWQGQEEGHAQAAYLARRLRPYDSEALASSLANDRRKLVHAKIADLFLSPARHVMIFFADLLGMEQRYNVPGTVNDENWTLRVPTDYLQHYEQGRLQGEALNLPCVLALALRAKPELVHAHADLITRLDKLAVWRLD